MMLRATACSYGGRNGDYEDNHQQLNTSRAKFFYQEFKTDALEKFKTLYAF